jgi:hypothetical protein
MTNDIVERFRDAIDKAASGLDSTFHDSLILAAAWSLDMKLTEHFKTTRAIIEPEDAALFDAVDALWFAAGLGNTAEEPGLRLKLLRENADIRERYEMMLDAAVETATKALRERSAEFRAAIAAAPQTTKAP